MSTSAYIKTYLAESEAEARNQLHPYWLQKFFAEFHASLEKKCDGASAGNRYVVPAAFSSALEHILPRGVQLRREVQLKELLSVSVSDPLSTLISAKRIDFVIEGTSTSKQLFIEFKTNINFNDLSAAMIEMAIVKRLAKGKAIATGSLHLFPPASNLDGLKALNREFFCSPLDFIWVLCERPSQKFNISAIKEFRRQIRAL